MTGIYFDHNATTPVDPAVVDAMLPFLREEFANASSGYAAAARVRAAIETAREQVAALVGCAASEIIFTSGGTESNNTAVHSALTLFPERRHVITTAVEHSAVLNVAAATRGRGYEVTFIGIDRDGRINVDEMRAALRDDAALLSVMWANNETGVVFPIREIAEIAAERGIAFHTDAIQAAGKLPIDLRDSPITMLSISAHKFYGPKGVGALYVNRRARFRPLLFGGGQENERRSGTENVAGIIGMGRAAELARENLVDVQTRVCRMRDEFERAITTHVAAATVNGAAAERLPNTSSISFDGIDSAAALLLLDQQGIACSAGSACRTGSLEPSHVLRAMGLMNEQARGSIRFSFGRSNTDAEVEHAIEIVPRIIAKLRAISAPAAVN